jgi:hypothetical protein
MSQYLRSVLQCQKEVCRCTSSAANASSTVEMYIDPGAPSFHPPLLMCWKKREALVDAQLRLRPQTGIWFVFPWIPTCTCYIEQPIHSLPNMTITTKVKKPWRFLSYQNAVFNLLLRPFPPIRSLLSTLLLLTTVYHAVRVAHSVWVTMRVFSPRCAVWEYTRCFLVFLLANIQIKASRQ